MLTKSELQWLEDREIQAKEDKGQYYCWYCKYHGYCDPLTLCPTSSSESFYRDAAEFEALTVEVMSWFPRGKICGSDCPYNDKCREEDCSRAEIRNARLIAEEDD